MSIINQISQSNYKLQIKNYFILEDQKLVMSDLESAAEQFWFELSNLLDNPKWEELKINDFCIKKSKLTYIKQMNLPIHPNELVYMDKFSEAELTQLTNVDVPVLQRAVFLSLQSQVQKLLEEGHQLKEKCSNKQSLLCGHNAITLALHRGDFSILKLLVESCENLELDFYASEKFSYDLVAKSPEFLSLLIKNGLLNFQMKNDKEGNSHFHNAAKMGHSRDVQSLIDCGADVNLESYIEQKTPLDLAVISGHVDVVRKLLLAGANVNSKSQPIFDAVQNQNGILVELLIQNKANCNVLKNDLELLISAINTENMVITRKLIDAGAIVSNAILLAMSNALPERFVPLLLNKVSPSDSIKDKIGLSVLHISVFKGKYDWVQKLLKQGIDPNTTTDTGITSLHIASWRGFKSIADALIEAGANINSIDYIGSTPLNHSFNSFFKSQITEMLITQNADQTINSYSNYDSIKQLNLELFPMALNIASVTKKTTQKWQECYLRKLCAHIFDVAGISKVIDHEGIEESLVLEGLISPIGFLEKLVSNTCLIFAKESVHSQIADIIASACQFCLNDVTRTNQEYLKRIQNGDPTFIISGYWSHGTIFLFWKDKFIECNSQSKKIIINSYKSEKLNEKIIAEIREARLESSENYVKLNKSIAKLLETSLIQDVDNLAKQQMGNCIWKSIEMAIYALFILNDYEGFKKGNHQVLNNYEYWLNMQKILFFDQYIANCQSMNNHYLPDFDLIRKIKEKLVVLDVQKYPKIPRLLADMENVINSSREEVEPKIQDFNIVQKNDTLFSHSFIFDDNQQPTYETIINTYF